MKKFKRLTKENISEIITDLLEKIKFENVNNIEFEDNLITIYPEDDEEDIIEIEIK